MSEIQLRRPEIDDIAEEQTVKMLIPSFWCNVRRTAKEMVAEGGCDALSRAGAALKRNTAYPHWVNPEGSSRTDRGSRQFQQLCIKTGSDRTLNHSPNDPSCGGNDEKFVTHEMPAHTLG